MQKNKIKLIDEIVEIGKERNILHLNASQKEFSGNSINVNDKKLVNFGSYSYLGLETDERLIKGATDAVNQYGTQYPSSRAYVSAPLYKEYEQLLNQLFGFNTILTTSTTLGHQIVLPIVITENDAILLDQQVHASVQEAIQIVKHKGIQATIVRHNNIQELEKKLNRLQSKHKKVWYLIDGIYSMYGDVAPFEEIKQLMEKYKSLHLYIDDAHGMSWTGINGTGYALEQIDISDRIILATSLNKAYAAGGAAFVIKDTEMYRKIKNCGGALIFAGQHQNSALGAGIAAAKIHLSQEINSLQQNLIKRIHYCHDLLISKGIPLLSDRDTPIFFIALGMPRAGYSLCQAMIDSGFMVNLAAFPAVPETCTGVRFTITNHLDFNDIEVFCNQLEFHFYQILQQESISFQDIQKAFRKTTSIPFQFNNKYSPTLNKKNTNTLKKEVYNSIKEVPPIQWDNLFKQSNFSYVEALQMLENTFTKQVSPEHNWDFTYIIIKDEHGRIVLATYFTILLLKDDLLAPSSTSIQIEKTRQYDSHYLCSKTILMGSSVSLGKHLFIDKTNNRWKVALKSLTEEIVHLSEIHQTNSIILRDFQHEEDELISFFHENGFNKISLPEDNLFNFTNTNYEDYLSSLGYKKKYKLKKEVLHYEDIFKINFTNQVSEEKLKHFFKLYQNVKNKNFEINDWELPFHFFKNLCKSSSSEILEIYLHTKYDKRKNRLPVGVVFCTKSSRYSPMLVGVDYLYAEQYNVYKQLILQLIKRAFKLGYSEIHFGMTASTTKRKFNIDQIPTHAFVQTKDHYHQEVIQQVSALSQENTK